MTTSVLPNVSQVAPGSPTNLMERLAALEAHNVAQDERIAALEAQVATNTARIDEAIHQLRTKTMNAPEDHPSE